MRNERCCRGLPVCPGNPDDICLGKPRSEFNFTYYSYSLLPYLSDHLRLLRYARTLHHQICLQNLFLRMLSFLKSDFPFLQLPPVLLLYLTGITYEHLVPLFQSKHRSADSAFSRTENDETLFHRYLTLSVTMVSTASMIPTIQNLETILLSCIPIF